MVLQGLITCSVVESFRLKHLEFIDVRIKIPCVTRVCLQYVSRSACRWPQSRLVFAIL